MPIWLKVLGWDQAVGMPGPRVHNGPRMGEALELVTREPACRQRLTPSWLGQAGIICPQVV